MLDPRPPQLTLANWDLASYVGSAPVSGIVIVRGGQIVFERYPRMQPSDRHLLMSVTKVFTSAVVGILERRGLLALERPADSYIDELADSGWAGVTVNDVLSMASGIDCLQVDSPGAYTDPGHPFFRFEASLGWRPGGAGTNTYELIASLPSHRRLRDLARFGMLFTSSGPGVIDAEHVRRIRAGTRPALHRSGGELPDEARAAYGRRLPPASRQWNYVTDDGDLFKGGFGGQGLYVSPDREVVIAYAGTPRQDGSVNQLRWLSRRLAHALG